MGFSSANADWAIPPRHSVGLSLRETHAGLMIPIDAGRTLNHVAEALRTLAETVKLGRHRGSRNSSEHDDKGVKRRK